jgi:hypothetical protein
MTRRSKAHQRQEARDAKYRNQIKASAIPTGVLFTAWTESSRSGQSERQEWLNADGIGRVIATEMARERGTSPTPAGVMVTRQWCAALARDARRLPVDGIRDRITALVRTTPADATDPDDTATHGIATGEVRRITTVVLDLLARLPSDRTGREKTFRALRRFGARSIDAGEGERAIALTRELASLTVVVDRDWILRRFTYGGPGWSCETTLTRRVHVPAIGVVPRATSET